MDKSKAAMEIVKEFFPWFHMGCLNMHGLRQFTRLKMHIYIYVEDSSLSVVVPSSLAIDSQHSFRTKGIANLAIQRKIQKTKSSTSVPQESQTTHNICFQVMLPH